MILLIGIVKKNAIMMIDFALEVERHGNKNSRDAIFEACLLRFRPIMMTTMAALLGALPLALGTGDGAELRRPLGISIVGGLILSQLLTLYTTPVVYLYLDRFGLWLRSRRGRARRWGEPCGAKRELTRMAPMVARSCCDVARLRSSLPVAIAALFGCMVGPNYVRPPLDTPAAYKEAQGWKQAEPKDEQPRGNWWEVFNDPDLNALVTQVAISNQTIKAAEARVREARAMTAAARAALFPLVTADASATRSGSGGGSGRGAALASTGQVARIGNNFNVALDASWEIDLWGGIRRTIEASEATAQASAAILEQRSFPRRRCWPKTTSCCAWRTRRSACSTTPSRRTRNRCSSHATSTPSGWPVAPTSRRRRRNSSRRRRRQSMPGCSARNSSTPSPCSSASRRRSSRSRPSPSRPRSR